MNIPEISLAQLIFPDTNRSSFFSYITEHIFKHMTTNSFALSSLLILDLVISIFWSLFGRRSFSDQQPSSLVTMDKSDTYTASLWIFVILYMP